MASEFVEFLIARGYSEDDATLIDELDRDNDRLRGEVDHLKKQLKGQLHHIEQLLALREPIDP